MRANRVFRNDEKAQVGIGTMIVFIATVLVAAVAAGVLIDVSGKLQERSSRTGTEATEQVSGNLNIVSILGRRDNTGQANLQDLDIFLEVAPGAPNMDLGQLRVQLKTTTVHTTFDRAAATDADSFALTEIRDNDNSFTATTFVVNGGDYVNLTIALDTASMTLAPRAQTTIILLPENGNKIELGFLTPASYGIQTKVLLK